MQHDTVDIYQAILLQKQGWSVLQLFTIVIYSFNCMVAKIELQGSWHVCNKHTAHTEP